MARLRRFLLRLINVFRFSRAEDELAREVESHLALMEDEFRQKGMTAAEARLAARRAFGGVEQAKERHRDARSFMWVDDARRDVRYTFRSLRRQPVFAVTAMITLALGIGVNTAVFSFGDALAFRPFDVPKPGELVRIFSGTKDKPFGAVSYREYLDFRDRSTTLSGLVAYGTLALSISRGPNETAKVVGALEVSDNYFSVLGIEPTVGRGFRAEDTSTHTAQAAVVISRRFWERAFQSDPAVIGQTVLISKHPFTVIGVAPPRFTGTVVFFQPDVYLPIAMAPVVVSSLPPDFDRNRRQRDFAVLGRVKSGVAASVARADIAMIAHTLEREYPDTNRERTASVLPELAARDQENDNIRPAALLLTLSGLALLVACLNLANVTLSRGVGRARELTIRLAIGASRGRLLRQLLTESLCLAFLGGLCALAIANAIVRYLSVIAQSILSNSDLPIVLDLRMDARVLGFTLLLSLGTAVIFGLLPALRCTRIDLNTAPNSITNVLRRRRRISARGALVTSQVALSTIVLAVAGLSIQQFTDVRQTDPGFKTDHVLLLTLDPSLAGYDQAGMHRFYEELLQRTRAMPSVTAVGLSQTIPLSGMSTGFSTSLRVDGYEMRAGHETVTIRSMVVDPGYWQTMRTRLVRGRLFGERDTATSRRVILVNETMARQYWPNRDAVGGTVRLDGANGPAEVIGIVQDGKYNDITEVPQPAVFIPFSQKNNRWMAATMIVRGAGDVTALATPIRGLVHTLDTGMPVFNVRSLENVYESRAILPQRLIAQMMSSMAGLSLVLAIVGLYGVIAYWVALRTREIGIRMALGATRGHVLLMVVGQASHMVGAGLVVGVGFTLALTPAFASAFNFAPRDRVGLAMASLILTIAALIGSVIPAQRAARTNPSVALRAE